MAFISDIKNIFLSGAAIYISDDFIDVAKASLALNGLNVFSLQRFPLLKNINGKSYVDAKEEIDKVLEKAFPNETDKPYRIATNLRNDSFILRRFMLREIPEHEVKHAIVFEAQKYIPYPIEDLVYGFRTCVKKRGIHEIIFGGAELKNVNNITDYFKTKNILPAVIEPTPILLTRALNLEKKLAREGAYLVIHYEPANKIIITGICHRQPHFFREVQVYPGDEEFKTSELSYPALKDVWTIIENDVVGGMEYLRKETKKEIDRLFISGFYPSAEEAELSKDLGVPLGRITPSFLKTKDVENSDRYLPVLALLHDSLHGPVFNLVPKETAQNDLWAFKSVAVKVGLVFFSIVLLHSIFVTVGSSQVKKIDKTRKSFALYKIVSPNASSEDVIRFKKAMEEKALFVNSTISKRMDVSEKMVQLAKDITPDSWIESLDYKNIIGQKASPSLKINGAIYAAAEIGVSSANKILENMKEDKVMAAGFKDIELVSVKKKKLLEKEITGFEIILK